MSNPTVTQEDRDAVEAKVWATFHSSGHDSYSQMHQVALHFAAALREERAAHEETKRKLATANRALLMPTNDVLSFDGPEDSAAYTEAYEAARNERSTPMPGPKHPCPECGREMVIKPMRYHDDIRASIQSYSGQWECPATPDQHEIVRLKAALAAAEKERDEAQTKLNMKENRIVSLVGTTRDLNKGVERLRAELSASNEARSRAEALLEEAKNLPPKFTTYKWTPEGMTSTDVFYHSGMELWVPSMAVYTYKAQLTDAKADLAAQKATNAAQAERVAELEKGVVELREVLKCELGRGKCSFCPNEFPHTDIHTDHLASTARLVPARDEQKEDGHE